MSNHIEELKLANNRLDDATTSKLLQGISENKSMRYKLCLIDLSHNNIGQETIAKIVKYISIKGCSIHTIMLEGDLLGDKTLKPLIEAIDSDLSDKFHYLNIAKNNVTDDLVPALCSMIANCIYLKNINLNNNKIKNAGAATLMKQLKSHSDIKVFDIGWNLIGDNFQILPTKLEMITQHQNRIIEVEKKLSKNQSSQNVKEQAEDKKKDQKSKGKDDEDPLSKIVSLYNNAEIFELKYTMGQGPHKVDKEKVSDFALALGVLFKESSSLLHLDISHNNINFVDSQHLSKEVVHNHSILGIHVDGNEMAIDDLGFITAVKKEDLQENFYASSQIYYEINSPLTKFNKKLNTSQIVRSIRSKNNCWICEGWREVKFTFRPNLVQNMEIHSKQHTINNSSVENFNRTRQITNNSNLESHIYAGMTGASVFNISRSSVDVKMHLSQNNYKNFDAEKSIDLFYGYRMCRPGVLRYYYTVNGEPVTHYGENTVNLNEAILAEYEKEKEFIDDETVRKQYIVHQVGEMSVEPYEGILTEEYTSKIKFCVPRPEKKIKTKVRPRTPWIFPDSIWAYFGYSYDGFQEESINDAFEFDYERGKIANDKDIKSSEEEGLLKSYLRQYYPQILDLYKYYSSTTGMGVFQVSQNSIIEFSNACIGLADKQYSVNFMFLKEAEVKNLDKEERKNKNKLVPDNMIRHQFLTFLVKIAKDKYISKVSKFNTLFEAVQYTFEKHYTYALNSQNHHRWRVERYYNEHVDNFIKAFYPIFEALFRSYSRREIGKRE